MLNGDPRAMGSVIAALICAVICVGGEVVAPPTGWIVGAAGFPVAVTLAWRSAGEVVVATGFPLLAGGLWFGARTILLTDAIVVGAVMPEVLVSGLPWVFDRPPIDWPIYLIGGAAALIVIACLLSLAGIILIGIPVSILVFPAALVWTAALKIAMRNDGHPTPSMTSATS